MIIIGSVAIRYWYPDFNRLPKDIDYAVISSKQYNSTRSTEYLENPILYKSIHSYHIIENNDKLYLSPEGLLTLKMSHLFWDINWNKHMFDVQFLLSKDLDIDKVLFYDLIDYWKEYLPKIRRSDLVMSREDFFSNAINYDSCEHDILHTLINPTPMYTLLLKGEVELDEDKFNQLSFEDKLEVVREEVYVMAYERYKHLNYMIAYKKMLDKFIRLHAPIYIAIFAIKNYIALLKPKLNYIKKIENGLQTKI